MTGYCVWSLGVFFGEFLEAPSLSGLRNYRHRIVAYFFELGLCCYVGQWKDDLCDMCAVASSEFLLMLLVVISEILIRYLDLRSYNLIDELDSLDLFFHIALVFVIARTLGREFPT